MIERPFARCLRPHDEATSWTTRRSEQAATLNLSILALSHLRRGVASLARFDQAFPEHPSSAETVLAELDEIGSPATMASAGGRFFGFVIGGALPRQWPQIGSPPLGPNTGFVVTSPPMPRSRTCRCVGKGYFSSARAERGRFVTAQRRELFSAGGRTAHTVGTRWLGC